jgi:hypothetical protein
MKFTADRPFADPEKAARKLIDIASTVETVQDGRVHIELINMPFLQAGGSADEYRAGIARAIANGWFWRHESGLYVKFTRAGADLFACTDGGASFEQPISLPTPNAWHVNYASDYITKPSAKI